MKEIQKVKAWRYPCEKAIEQKSDELGLGDFFLCNHFKTRKHLIRYQTQCSCDKNCKPQKIEIIVREAR